MIGDYFELCILVTIKPNNQLYQNQIKEHLGRTKCVITDHKQYIGRFFCEIFEILFGGYGKKIQSIMELLSEIFLDRREGEKTPLYLCDCKWNVALHILSKYIQAPFTQPTIFLKIDFS